VINQIFEQRGVQDRGDLEFLAGNRRSYDSKNSRTDDRADTQRCKRPRPERLLEPLLGILRVGNQSVYAFDTEKL